MNRNKLTISKWVEGKKGILNGKVSGNGVRSFNRDVLVFAFFLFLSFIFWYLNALRKDLEVELKYPVKYINAPRDKALGSDVVSKLTLNLRGPGYSIVKLKLSANRAPLVIDFSKVTWKRVPDTRTDYYIVSGGLISNFSRQLRSEFQVASIKPDTIYFSLEKKVVQATGTKPTGGGR